ncbi:MAG: sigma-70 family RNA polymerase sigma factor [Planctomycetota bacterium]
MSDELVPFADLLAKARTGDNSALTQLVEKYEGEIRMVARVQLGPALRPHLDSIDLVQSVHRSLMLGLRSNKFEITDPESLIALALTMVRRKVARHWRHLQRQQRLSRGPEADTHFPNLLASLSSPQSDPAEIAQRNDAIAKLWSHLDPSERKVIELRMQGHSTVEVAETLHLDADVLRVRLSRLRQRLRAEGLLIDWL